MVTPYLAPFLKYSEIMVKLADCNLPYIYLALHWARSDPVRKLESLGHCTRCCVIVCLAALVQYRRVTNGQTY